MLGLCRSVLSMTMLNARMKAVSGFGKTDPFWIIIVAVAVTATTIIIAVITTTTTVISSSSSSIVVITTIIIVVVIMIMIMMIMMTISSSSRARWGKSPKHTQTFQRRKGRKKEAKKQRNRRVREQKRDELALASYSRPDGNSVPHPYTTRARW